VVISLSKSSRHFVASDFNRAASNEHAARIGPSRRHNARRRAFSWSALALLVLAAVGWLTWSFGIWETVTSPARFRGEIQGLGAWAPAAYFLIEVVQVIVPPIPGGIFPPVAAALFGPLSALLLTMAGATIGSAVAFALARVWGRPLLERLVSAPTIDRYGRIIAAKGGLWLFLVMIIPVLPGDSLCALMGSTTISFRRFLLVTTLGRLPMTFCGVYLTTTLTTIPLSVSLLAGALALIALVLGFRMRERLETWLMDQADEVG
jgi:uncharacterized membrane protein YdjX (TVP38/TMEM64 family)